MVAQFVVFYVLHVYRQQFDFFSKCKFVAKPQAVGRNQFFFSVNLFGQIFIIIINKSFKFRTASTEIVC